MSKHLNQLISLSKKGNETAMLQLYDRYGAAMFRIANRYLNEEDAKDAMQEGFLKAFKHLDHFEPTATFGAWLKRIIINQCIDMLKKRQLQFTEMDAETLLVLDDDNWKVESTLTKKEVLASIERLPMKYRVVVKLYLLEGYDHDEISHILNMPIQTSRTHLRRGRLQLQDLLKNTYNVTRY